jgi:hypothetical protein
VTDSALQGRFRDGGNIMRKLRGGIPQDAYKSNKLRFMKKAKRNG